MSWEILWALILGFTLSAVVQAVVRRESVVRLLGKDSPKALAAATGLGMASSSCSYAAVALARSLFRKGATFTAAMAFEIASTHLRVEIGGLVSPLAGRHMGAARRSYRRGGQLCLLDRQRAVGGGAVERWDQLRRRRVVHLRRPDHPADPEHLPEVLRLADGRVHRGDVLRHDGGRR